MMRVPRRYAAELRCVVSKNRKHSAGCVGRAYLERDEDNVRLAGDSDYYGSQLDSLGGIFDLEYSALGRAK